MIYAHVDQDINIRTAVEEENKSDITIRRMLKQYKCIK